MRKLIIRLRYQLCKLQASKHFSTKILQPTMKIFLNILCFFIFLPTYIFAQNNKNGGTIKGAVFTSDGKAATYVSVKIKAAKKYTITNDEGSFTLKNIIPGQYEIEVSMVGYKPVTTEVTVQKDSVSDVSISLLLTESDLKEVVVTGTRRGYVAEKPSESLRLNTPLIETPQNITVTMQQTIKDIGALSLSDILRTSSGVIANGAKQDISVSIRGTQVYSSILRNGVGSGYWFNQEPDAGMIERVEFIKGPAGFMISNTEPGGLVNTVTKQPTHDKVASVNFGYGSYNMFRTNIDLGGEVKKGGALTYRINAGAQQQDDYYQFGYLKKQFVAAALTYDVDDRTSITAEYNYIRGHSLVDGNQVPTINGKFFALPINTAIVDPNTPGTVSADHYYRLNVKHKLDDNWSLNAQAAYVNGPWGGNMMYLDEVSANYDTIYRASSYTNWQNNLKTAQAFLSGSFNTGVNINHKILAGIDYGSTEVSSQGGGTWGERKYPLALAEPTFYIPVDSIKNFDHNAWSSKYGSRYSALYLQDHIKFYNKFVLTLAARYTHSLTWADYNNPYEQTDNKVVPRVGVTYLFTENISAYALYDAAFIPQNGKSFTGQLFKPLIGNNKEVGLKGLFFNKKLSGSLSAYKITKTNALTTDPEHTDFQIQTGELVSEGIEFDLNGNVTNNLNLMANYAHNNARITKDNNKAMEGLRNNGSVANVANIFAKYKLLKGALKGVNVGAGVQYADRMSGGLFWQENTFAGYLPGRTLLEASLGYTTNKFYCSLNAYNLANKKYITAGYRSSTTDWIYTAGDPINFRLDFGIRL